MQNTIEIPLKKGKTKWILAVCVLCFLFSLWLFNYAENQTDYPKTAIKAIGSIGFIFFGVCGLFFAKKTTDTTAGLILTNKGIEENTNGLLTQKIDWKDITGFEGRNEKLILVKVKKPKKYIDKASNNAQKRILKLNETDYGTPVFIDTTSLEKGFEEVLEILNNKQPNYKK